MLKPPAPTIPGMTDTLDFVKNLWGSMNIPGAGMPGMSGMAGLAAPPLSTDELDKRITDLKAVESWLNMNVTMLRGTIQALEVQRGTLAALKSMSASMADAMRQSGISSDKMGAMPFASFFTPPSPAASAKPAAPAPAQASAAPAGGAAPGGADAGAAGAAAMGMPAAVAWWNMLQDQFTQAVGAAMSPAAQNAPAAPGATPASAPPAPFAPQANAAPPAPAPSAAAGPNAGADGGAAGNGKARAPRTRADKT